MKTAPTRRRIKTIRCWEPYTGAPAKNCTRLPGHDGDHVHEYTGLSWSAEPRTHRVYHR
ncbi:hypothetical protein [Streptomyces formicae]|uniref:Mobile element protein n=1 Tax=Streptomyces formicae TaxID=1616117 RepID=A0ABY3WXN3_9ACTN|nr:hypothetical protein [Streptomyces formicae]UNM15305.1 hypothetical protein J4032_30995 [Streptomyces formicae]